MSRPVYEPTLERTDAALGFGQDQLFRRPRPFSGTCVSIFRALLYLDPVTLGSGTSVVLDWDDWENGDTSVFDPRDTAGNPDPVVGVDQVRRVRLLAEGRYSFSCGVYLNRVGNFTVAQYMDDGDPIFGHPEMVVHGQQTYNDGGGNIALQSTGYLNMGFDRYYTLMDPFGSGSWVPSIQWRVAQTRSTSNSVDEAWMEIHYECATDPTTPSS